MNNGPTDLAALLLGSVNWACEAADARPLRIVKLEQVQRIGLVVGSVYLYMHFDIKKSCVPV